MITSWRLKRVRQAILFDEGVMKDKEKKPLLKQLDIAIKKYYEYEMTTKLEYLEDKISRHFVEGIPEALKKEALCVIADLIDHNCKVEGIDYKWLSKFEKGYIDMLVETYNVEGRNKELIEYALGYKQFNPQHFKVNNNYDNYGFDDEDDTYDESIAYDILDDDEEDDEDDESN